MTTTHRRIRLIAAAPVAFAALLVVSPVGTAEPPPPGCTIIGTEGNDMMQGTPGDVICGLGGVDEINGWDGNDQIYGGEGFDKLAGRGGNDSIYGGPGDDFLSGAEGDDRLYGDDGYDILKGWDGWDVCEGGEETEQCEAGRPIARIQVPTLAPIPIPRPGGNLVGPSR
jgi:hypothetical protein